MPAIVPPTTALIADEGSRPPPTVIGGMVEVKTHAAAVALQLLGIVVASVQFETFVTKVAEVGQGPIYLYIYTARCLLKLALLAITPVMADVIAKAE